jgi:hypothetical protein
MSIAPQPISTTPTKGAENSGQGIPIVVKRPTPKSAGKRNFWIPSVRNTVPTIKRIRMVALPSDIFIGKDLCMVNQQQK